MAFVVLLSSTGFGLVEHSCMMRGKSVELSALKKEDSACKMCQPVAGPKVQISSALPVFNKKACCEESQKHQKIEVVSATSSAVKVLKASPFHAALGEHMGSPLQLKPFLLSSFPPSSFKTFSSLLYGRTMLLFVQSFLI